MSNEKNQRDDASNPDLPSIRRALRGEDEFKPVFPELQSQNDERVAFVPQTYAGFAAVHLNESGHPPDEQQSFDAGVRAGLARATQQATKGDERAAFENDIAFVADHTLARLNKKGCPGEWVDYAYEQIIAAGYVRQQAKSRATTPPPVAVRHDQRRAIEAALEGRPLDRINRAALTSLLADVEGDWVNVGTVAGSAGQAPTDWTNGHIATFHPDGDEYVVMFNRDMLPALRREGALKAYTAPSLATDAGAVLTDERRGAISYALGYASSKDGVNPTILEPLRALLAAHPTKQRPDPSDIQGWAVTVNVNAVDILTIGHNSLSGIDNISDFAEVVRNCAMHLMGFIGDDRTEQRMSDAAREEQPSWTNPMTPYGLLVRALRIVAGTTLMDMATSLRRRPAELSALEFGRKPVTNADIVDAAHYFSTLGIQSTTHALTMAAARKAEIERSGVSDA